MDSEKETDEKFFRRLRRDRESTPINSGIHLKIPRTDSGYINTGLPTDVKKDQKHVHEMLGHLGWKTIQKGLTQVHGCEGLVNLLEGVGDNRHCTVCELTMSKLSRKGFGVIRDPRYKNQSLMGVNKIFKGTGVPDETQIDGEGALASPETQEWFDGVKTHCVKM